MTKIIEALFDGVAFRPDEPIELPPNTRVRLTIESPPTPGASGSFLRAARALTLNMRRCGKCLALAAPMVRKTVKLDPDDEGSLLEGL